MLRVRNNREYFAWPQNKPKARLLIVDDEANIRSSLVRGLRLLGYFVEEAGSGHEALALLEHTTPDLMVLDMNMPGMDGVEVMRRTRQIQPEMSIIILTGYATLENAVASVKLAAADYLRKPASIREIANAVTRSLEKRAKLLRQQQLHQVLDKALDALHQAKILPNSPLPSVTSPIPAAFNLGVDSQYFMRVHPLMLDRQNRQVTVEDSPSRPVQLTKGEMAVLVSMMAQPNQVFSCQELVQAAWGYDTDEDEAKSVIRPYISRLRRKLKANPQTPNLICTMRRRGYYFASVRE